VYGCGGAPEGNNRRAHESDNGKHLRERTWKKRKDEKRTLLKLGWVEKNTDDLGNEYKRISARLQGMGDQA